MPFEDDHISHTRRARSFTFYSILTDLLISLFSFSVSFLRFSPSYFILYLYLFSYKLPLSLPLFELIIESSQHILSYFLHHRCNNRFSFLYKFLILSFLITLLIHFSILISTKLCLLVYYPKRNPISNKKKKNKYFS